MQFSAATAAAHGPHHMRSQPTCAPPPVRLCPMCPAVPVQDLLHKKRMNLDICRYLCLDEADRMVDQVGRCGSTSMGREEKGGEVRAWVVERMVGEEGQ